MVLKMHGRTTQCDHIQTIAQRFYIHFLLKLLARFQSWLLTHTEAKYCNLGKHFSFCGKERV